MKIEREIFRSYDIRGIVDTNLGASVVQRIGQSFGTIALEANQPEVIIGGDGRLTTPALKQALAAGLNAAGCDVIDIGLLPTPLLYYATRCAQINSRTGIMVTGSHNPPEYNGLKIVLDGDSFSEDSLSALYDRVIAKDASDCALRVSTGTDAGTGAGEIGDLSEQDVTSDYVREIQVATKLDCHLKIVVDAGNGIAGGIGPSLLEAVGIEVIPLYCDVDGSFPNHHPDPTEPSNLTDLIASVQSTGADFGVAFDGDGDRLGVVTGTGRVVVADQLLMLFATSVLAEHPGTFVVFDVKCTRHLGALITALGGKPILWQTGHSRLKAKIKASGAKLGGEYSGHICFADRWYGFDDALYSAVRLAELVASKGQSLDALFDALPKDISTPELKIHTSESAKFTIMDAISAARGQFSTQNITDIDGLRVEYQDGWGLIRASNTSPTLTLRFEAQTESALKYIRSEFASVLESVAPELQIPE